MKFLFLMLVFLLVPFFILIDAQSDQIIPVWIKNNAGWWASDNISEFEFLNAIEYLIEHQIIKISISENENSPLIKTTFTLPDSRTTKYAEITGSFSEKHEGALTLTIVKPDKSTEKITTISRDGTFMTVMPLTSESLIGNYQVFAEIKGEQIPVSIFDVQGGDSSKVPPWIKNNAGWWANGQITDGEFVMGIQYLVEHRIIQIEKIVDCISNGGNWGYTSCNFVKPEKTESEIIGTCQGTAKCITEKVTRIIDGDTIYTDSYKIRLALTNTPEKGEAGFAEATSFTAKSCPVGSTIIVDQDDGQLYDTYDRLLGKIFI